MKRMLITMLALQLLLCTASAHLEETRQQTGYSKPVPAAYALQSRQSGTVEKLIYDTRDYYGDGRDVQKTAYVYLPYGYEPADTVTRYNILYLMHGWTGAAGEYFFAGNGYVENLLDRMIEKGDIAPLIVVSPSFYTEESSRDFGPSPELIDIMARLGFTEITKKPMLHSVGKDYDDLQRG